MEQSKTTETATEALVDQELLRSNLASQLRLRRHAVELLRRDGLPFHRPLPKQDLFHRAAALYNRRGLFAGNRYGKSLTGCVEDTSWLRGARLFYPEGDPARTAGIPRHAVKLLVITTDWDKVDEIWTNQRGNIETRGKIWRYLPNDFIKSSRRNHAGVIDTIECANGSLARFDTVKSWLGNPAGSESSDWDAVHVDEPCPTGMWQAVSRGLIDRRGSAWFTLTPLSEAWITDYFRPEDLGGKKDERKWSITATIYENEFLSRAAIAEYESTLTDDEKQCRLHGVPFHLSGLVYKEFAWAKHVCDEVPHGWQDMLTPPSDYTVYVAIDPHPRVPHAVLFCAVSPTGHRFYYTDIFDHCVVGALCAQIRAVLGKNYVAEVRIDPSAYIEDPITGTTLAEEFHRHGIFVEPASKDLAGGILKVKQSLKTDPTFHILPSARRTLWEIVRYTWKEDTNKPIDKDDHAMECLRRLELLEPKWVDQNDSQNKSVSELSITRAELDTKELEFV